MSDLRDVVRRIREQADLLDIVGRAVALKRSGGRWWGCCPFHAEKTPSFCVRPEVGYYHCFGCGKGGSVIDFVMETERLDFLDTVRKLARELRIEMPEFRPEEREARDEDERRRRGIEAANLAALAFFRRSLERRTNPLANDYLPQRGLTEASVERFQIGAAPAEWSALTDHLRREGFAEEALLDAGLSVRNEEKGTVYDRFRNRLIFPIMDHNGKVAGFGGRALTSDDRTPKYLNSAETLVYKKGRILYALNVAGKPIQEAGHAVLCEGYMDVVMAHAHGVTNAVGSLGTALTPDQAKLLKKFTSRVYFLYDGDAAGRKAMLRGGEPLLAAGLDTRVVTLPTEHDPDTFLREHGPGPLRERFKSAPEYLDFAIEAHGGELDMRSLAGQAELLERLAPVLRAIGSDVLREAAITRVQQAVPGIPREAISRMVRNAPKPTQGPGRPPEDSGPRNSGEGQPQAALAAVGARSGATLERSLLKLMVESDEALEYIRANLRHEWVEEGRFAPLLYQLLDSDEDTRAISATMAAGGSGGEFFHLLTEVSTWDVPLSPSPAEDAAKLILRIHERHRLALTREYLKEISLLPPEEAEKHLRALHQEHKKRIETIGSQIRLGSNRRRRMQ